MIIQLGGGGFELDQYQSLVEIVSLFLDNIKTFPQSSYHEEGSCCTDETKYYHNV